MLFWDIIEVTKPLNSQVSVRSNHYLCTFVGAEYADYEKLIMAAIKVLWHNQTMTHLYPWQIESWQQILTRLHREHMPHGVLINGPAGIGKIDFARRLARLLLCQKSQEQACGTCSGCNWFAASTHPDFFEITPLEGKSTISINQVRELVASLSQTAAAGGYQVVLIHPAEAMSTAAANALLKTLEEPPGRVVLMLVSTQRSALPATIISRCQAIKMPTPSFNQAYEWLKGELSDPTQADWLLAFADGLPLIAKNFSEQDFSVVNQLFADFNPFEVASIWHKDDPMRLLAIMASLLMDMVRSKCGVSQERLRHQKIATLIHQYAGRWQEAALFEYLRVINEDLALLRSQANPNVQLLLEKNLIQWQNCV